ncbi:uncharacterized protein BROUX77_002270 [Berkeleyomyces rouxiae]|uniref:uncharacterized protein n=1 Tax=Berkeleyomyces rouxiae TaxID=2035830 RepID=UPI003B776644
MSPPTSAAAPVPPTSDINSSVHQTKTIQLRGQPKAFVSPPRSPLKNLQANRILKASSAKGSSGKASPEKTHLAAIKTSKGGVKNAKTVNLELPVADEKPYGSPRKKTNKTIGDGGGGTPTAKLTVTHHVQSFFSPKPTQGNTPMMRSALINGKLREQLLESKDDKAGKSAVETSPLRSPVIHTYGLGKQSLLDKPMQKITNGHIFANLASDDSAGSAKLWDIPFSPVKTKPKVELYATPALPTSPPMMAKKTNMATKEQQNQVPNAPFPDMRVENKNPGRESSGILPSLKPDPQPSIVLSSTIIRNAREGDLTTRFAQKQTTREARNENAVILISSDGESSSEDSETDSDSDDEFVPSGKGAFRTKRVATTKTRKRPASTEKKGLATDIGASNKDESQKSSGNNHIYSSSKLERSTNKDPPRFKVTGEIVNAKSSHTLTPAQQEQHNRVDKGKSLLQKDTFELRPARIATDDYFNFNSSGAESDHQQKLRNTNEATTIDTQRKKIAVPQKQQPKKPAPTAEKPKVQSPIELLAQLLSGAGDALASPRKTAKPKAGPTKKRKTEHASESTDISDLSSLVVAKLQGAQSKKSRLQAQKSLRETEKLFSKRNTELVEDLKNESMRLETKIQKAYDAITNRLDEFSRMFDDAVPSPQEIEGEFTAVMNHAKGVGTIYNEVKDEFQKYHLKVPVDDWNKDWDEVDEIIALGEQLGQKIIQTHVSAEPEPGKAYHKLMESLSDKEKAIAPVLFPESLEELRVKSWGQAVWGLWEALNSVAEITS